MVEPTSSPGAPAEPCPLACGGAVSPQAEATLCTSLQGQWHCVTCHFTARNNLQANGHEREQHHTMVWFCHEHGRLEHAI